MGGLTGLAYEIHVATIRHAVGLVVLDWQDWLPYVGVPALGVASLIVGALGLIAEKSFAPYAIAGAIMLLLFAGLYGAWALTLWMVKNRDTTERNDDSQTGRGRPGAGAAWAEWWPVGDRGPVRSSRWALETLTRRATGGPLYPPELRGPSSCDCNCTARLR